jgi:uncharacterized membrane protein
MGIASVIALLVLFRLSGVRLPMLGLLFAGAAGYFVGRQVGVRVPGWTLLAVGAAGGITLIAGLSQYNDDACCSTALVVLLVIAIGLFSVLAFMTGLAIGGVSESRSRQQR